jgi:hypothetical protein
MNQPGEGAIRLADAIEAAAYGDLYAAAPSSLECHTEILRGATPLLAPRIPDTFFNRVIDLGVERPATVADLDAVLGVYRGAGISAFWLHLSPGARPLSLVQ